MKVSIQDFCQDFYDSQIFHSVIAGQDVMLSFIDTAYDSIVKIDKSFNTVDRSIFRKEMIAVRMEMVGLAFRHNIKKDGMLLDQSVFTKNYLRQNNEMDIWGTMLDYSQAIAQSGYHIVCGERIQQAVVTTLLTYRIELFKELRWKRADAECAARVINHTGTEVACSKGITVRYLTDRLVLRLGCNENLSQEAFLGLGGVIFGFYEDAKAAIKSISFR